MRVYYGYGAAEANDWWDLIMLLQMLDQNDGLVVIKGELEGFSFPDEQIRVSEALAIARGKFFI